MKYTKINLDQWDRGELFQFYMEHMRIVMSLTVDVDVTRLIRFTRQSGLNFYGVMVWTVSKVVNAHDEFKYGWSKGGDLIRWEVISPSYVHFHPEDSCFTKLFTPFSPDLASFHAQFLADKEAYPGPPGHPAWASTQLLRRLLPALGTISPLRPPCVRRRTVPCPSGHLGKV